jgi:hypothetical protein
LRRTRARRLRYHGQDGPCDQQPVLVQIQRHHRLDVEDVLNPFPGTEVEVGVVLQRDADQVRDGVLHRAGELRGRILARLDDAIAEIALVAVPVVLVAGQSLGRRDHRSQ